MIIARDRRQARVIKRFIVGLLRGVKMLRSTIEEESAERIELKNRVCIEIHTASYRSVRGYTVIACLLDEVAFWSTEDSAEPDTEIIAALRPAMATIPNTVMLCASSPYARKGALWGACRRHYGRDGDPVLVWQAPTRVMNPSIPQRVVDEAMEADPTHAAAEYLATFRVDVETFVSRKIVDAAVVAGRRELPRIVGVRYVAFVDPSGGSSDSMTLAIAHVETKNRVVLDAVRERKPPFSPDDVVGEFAALLKAYGIVSARGDRYGGEWPRERFRTHGIDYVSASSVKNDLYRELLPILNGGRCELLDHPRLVAQLCSVERRTARGGRDSIDHPPGAHDDVANAVAGAVVTANRASAQEIPLVMPAILTRSNGWVGGTTPSGSNVPPNYQARHDEPWRRFIDSGGNIVTLRWPRPN